MKSPFILQWLHSTQEFIFFKFITGWKPVDFFGTTNIEPKSYSGLFYTWTVASFLSISSLSFSAIDFSFSFIFTGGGQQFRDGVFDSEILEPLK